MTINQIKEVSSFRDPAGHIYYDQKKVYRQINPCYFKEYDYLINSGLYQELKEQKYLITHQEIKRTPQKIIIQVEKIPYISYPYEWCFDQIKDTALLTLNILKIALKYNMILKDASIYNTQIYKGAPIFIDTLSFTFYEEGQPWSGYGQFCRHFLAPLLLMSYVDERCNSLFKNYIDGIPLDLTMNLLNKRGGFTAKQHIIWHNNSIKKYQNTDKKVANVFISKQNIFNIINMLIRQIQKIKSHHSSTEWENYYKYTNYSLVSDNSKIKLVTQYLDKIAFTNKDIIYDFGANNGKYSRIAAQKNVTVIAFDFDLNAIRTNYLTIQKEQEQNILPLFLDCNNPTPSIGFANRERVGLNDRPAVKCLMALALIHHLAISNNVPFNEIALWFSNLTEYLIIEFIPKEDSQIQKLLKNRLDIFDWYSLEQFELIFDKYFQIIHQSSISDSKRVLYLMKKKTKK